MASEWISALRKASFRGVPFGVLTSEGRFGRRLAVHEYPGRDTAWAEDMGQSTRRIGIVGFLVTDSRVYGGGDVIAQRERLIAAVETKGPGKLVHPTLGDLNVSVDSLVVAERWDTGRYFEVSFAFVEAGERVFPRQEPEPAKKVAAKGLAGKLEAVEAYVKKATDALRRGSIEVQKALATARQWTARITSLGQDATGLFRLTGAMVGSFGRYFLGALKGGFSAFTGFKLPDGGLAGLAAADAGRRAALGLAGDDVLSALEALGVGGTLDDVAGAVFAQIESLTAGIANPADAVRLLLDLTRFSPTPDLSQTAMGAALCDLYRRAAVVSLAGAATAYQPASYDDAADLLDRVVSALDAEILLAGDAGEDGAFAALRDLRGAVVEDLRARGADLAPIVTFTTLVPMPAPALAQRFYRDPDRADELVIQADPVHPMFMPVSFQALAR